MKEAAMPGHTFDDCQSCNPPGLTIQDMPDARLYTAAEGHWKFCGCSFCAELERREQATSPDSSEEG
jgi:hypothetical protein